MNVIKIQTWGWVDHSNITQFVDAIVMEVGSDTILSDGVTIVCRSAIKSLVAINYTKPLRSEILSRIQTDETLPEAYAKILKDGGMIAETVI